MLNDVRFKLYSRVNTLKNNVLENGHFNKILNTLMQILVLGVSQRSCNKFVHFALVKKFVQSWYPNSRQKLGNYHQKLLWWKCFTEQVTWYCIQSIKASLEVPHCHALKQRNSSPIYFFFISVRSLMTFVWTKPLTITDFKHCMLSW